ncbi:GIY-YIG nuclease family protein [Ekhidna sp.]
MIYFVYILYSSSLDKYYKGQTNDLNDRVRRHNDGYEKYTKSGVPWRLVWNVEKRTRSEAIILERKLKNMNRDKLESFIKKYS